MGRQVFWMSMFKLKSEGVGKPSQNMAKLIQKDAKPGDLIVLKLNL